LDLFPSKGHYDNKDWVEKPDETALCSKVHQLELIALEKWLCAV